jgi:hypothetical protein
MVLPAPLLPDDVPDDVPDASDPERIAPGVPLSVVVPSAPPVVALPEPAPPCVVPDILEDDCCACAMPASPSINTAQAISLLLPLPILNSVDNDVFGIRRPFLL